MATKTKSFSRSVAAPAAKPARFHFNDLIAIIVVAAIGYFAVHHFSAANSAARQIADVKSYLTTDVDAALKSYKNDIGSYPSTRQGLKALVEQPDNVNNWKGPYLAADPAKDPLKDAWGMPLQYSYPGKHGGSVKFDVSSMGPDKKAGTPDDIGNW